MRGTGQGGVNHWWARMGWPAMVAAFLVLPGARADSIRVDIRPGQRVNAFRPWRALGAGIDGIQAHEFPQVYTPENIRRMLAAGHGMLSYRLFTELSAEQWHWNPAGHWSDPSGRGYFTGSDVPNGTLETTYGYSLPHRGFTFDHGVDSGHSRLTDGDAATYWKSNPYLARPYTGEPDSEHPQWLVVDLGEKRPVNAVRIQWANPYATDYQVQYWTGPEPFDEKADGAWQAFPNGTVTHGTGGDVLLRVSDQTIPARFLRVLMTASSGTFDTHGPGDRRNGLGYAVAEIGVGTTDGDGSFVDLVNHAPNQTQTPTYVSSVDPWHGPDDKVADQVQVGLDQVFNSGLTRGMPAMIPVGLAYGTPDDAAAEMRYLKRRGFPVAWVEMGEEADEQQMSPEDYGALYLQWANAIHAVDPSLKLGGPALSSDDGVKAWADADGETDWLLRFVHYLREHDRLSDLSFVSMEHYPFDGPEEGWKGLRQVASRVVEPFTAMEDAGLPDGFPLFITEYNFSWDFDPAAQGVQGAVWQADFVGRFLADGGAGAFFYQYEPLAMHRGHAGWGTFSMFTVDGDGRARQPTSQFYVSRMINTEWCQPGDAEHAMYPAWSDVMDADGNALVTAYALHRPDGAWSLLVVNKDPERAHTVTVSFRNGSAHSFAGPVRMVTFSGASYAWHENGADSYADPDDPPTVTDVGGGPDTPYTLPPGSVTVLRGRLR